MIGKAAILSIVVAGGVAGGALAEALSYTAAKREVVSSKRTVFVLGEVGFLGEKEQAIVAALKDNITYYGALALSPDEGLYVDWLQAAAQYHSRQGAKAAALAQCEANRKRASAPCVVVLEVMPKGEKNSPALSLSSPASEALRKEYRKLDKPRQFRNGTRRWGARTGRLRKNRSRCSRL